MWGTLWSWFLSGSFICLSTFKRVFWVFFKSSSDCPPPPKDAPSCAWQLSLCPMEHILFQLLELRLNFASLRDKWAQPAAQCSSGVTHKQRFKDTCFLCARNKSDTVSQMLLWQSVCGHYFWKWIIRKIEAVLTVIANIVSNSPAF